MLTPLVRFTDQSWDGRKSRWYNDTDYRNACLLPNALPIQEPDGRFNINALRIAASRLIAMKGMDGQRRDAARRLIYLLRLAHQNMPQALSDIAMMKTTRADSPEVTLLRGYLPYAPDPQRVEMAIAYLQQAKVKRTAGNTRHNAKGQFAEGGAPKTYTQHLSTLRRQHAALVKEERRLMASPATTPEHRKAIVALSRKKAALLDTLHATVEAHLKETNPQVSSAEVDREYQRVRNSWTTTKRMTDVASLRARLAEIQRGFNPSQPRGPNGKFLSTGGKDVHGVRMPFAVHEALHAFETASRYAHQGYVNHTRAVTLQGKDYIMKRANAERTRNAAQDQRNEAAVAAGVHALGWRDVAPSRVYHLVDDQGNHYSVQNKLTGVSGFHDPTGHATQVTPQSVQRTVLAEYLFGIDNRTSANTLVDASSHAVHLIDNAQAFTESTPVMGFHHYTSYAYQIMQAQQGGRDAPTFARSAVLQTLQHQNQVMLALNRYQLTPEERALVTQRFASLATAYHAGVPLTLGNIIYGYEG